MFQVDDLFSKFIPHIGLDPLLINGDTASLLNDYGVDWLLKYNPVIDKDIFDELPAS